MTTAGKSVRECKGWVSSKILTHGLGECRVDYELNAPLPS